MDRSTAERWVVISALVVIATYGYRRIVEPVQQGNIANIVGIGNPVPLAEFMTAWGFVYFCIAIVANAAPGLGGSFAILVATGDLLANAPALLGDVGKQEQPPGTTSGKTSSTKTSTTIKASPSKPPVTIPHPF